MSKFVFVSTPSVLVKDDILGSWPVFSKDVVARSKGGFGRDCPCVSASVRINHALASSFHSPPHVFVALVPRLATRRSTPFLPRAMEVARAMEEALDSEMTPDSEIMLASDMALDSVEMAPDSVMKLPLAMEMAPQDLE